MSLITGVVIYDYIANIIYITGCFQREKLVDFEIL